MTRPGKGKGRVNCLDGASSSSSDDSGGFRAFTSRKTETLTERRNRLQKTSCVQAKDGWNATGSIAMTRRVPKIGGNERGASRFTLQRQLSLPGWGVTSRIQSSSRGFESVRETRTSLATLPRRSNSFYLSGDLIDDNARRHSCVSSTDSLSSSHSTRRFLSLPVSAWSVTSSQESRHISLPPQLTLETSLKSPPKIKVLKDQVYSSQRSLNFYESTEELGAKGENNRSFVHENSEKSTPKKTTDILPLNAYGRDDKSKASKEEENLRTYSNIKSNHSSRDSSVSPRKALAGNHTSSGREDLSPRVYSSSLRSIYPTIQEASGSTPPPPPEPPPRLLVNSLQTVDISKRFPFISRVLTGKVRSLTRKFEKSIASGDSVNEDTSDEDNDDSEHQTLEKRMALLLSRLSERVLRCNYLSVNARGDIIQKGPSRSPNLSRTPSLATGSYSTKVMKKYYLRGWLLK